MAIADDRETIIGRFTYRQNCYLEPACMQVLTAVCGIISLSVINVLLYREVSGDCCYETRYFSSM
jgi:hypothetical protein